MLAVQNIRLDPSSRRAWRDDQELSLSRKEFDLLHALMSRPGVIVSRSELMEQVWNTTFFTSSKTIDVHLGWLRRKLGDDARDPMLITTHRARGLRFELAPRQVVGSVVVAPVVAVPEASAVPAPVS